MPERKHSFFKEVFPQVGRIDDLFGTFNPVCFWALPCELFGGDPQSIQCKLEPPPKTNCLSPLSSHYLTITI